MEDLPKYIMGIDIGTENVRGVMATVNDGMVSVVGYAEEKNAGMRKGEVANLSGPAEAIDRVAEKIQRMSGLEVKSAVVSVNGQHVQSAKIEGMIVVGDVNHEVNEADLERINDAALAGRIQQNREILAVVPFEYILDGQGGIKDPLGMNGARLEMRASVVSALAPNCSNVTKVVDELTGIGVQDLVPAVVAAGNAVLSEKQREHGVAVVDFGATTTGVAVFDEGELQSVFVIPVGSDMLTKDLANVLEIDMETAEELKCRFVKGVFSEGGDEIILKRGKEQMVFDKKLVDENARARLVSIFEKVREGLERSGYGWKLPEGVVIVGGGAKMEGIEVLAKEVLRTATKIGAPRGLIGLREAVAKPEYAAAVGLMLMANEDGQIKVRGAGNGKSAGKKKGGGFLARILGKF